MNKSAILSLVFLLVACSAQQGVISVQTGKYVVRSELSDVKNIVVHTQNVDRQIGDGNWLTYIDDIDQFQIAYPANRPIEQPVFMMGMSMERQEANTPCTPSLTGASEVTPLPATEGATTWGKVDFWDEDNVLFNKRMAADDPFKPIPVPLCHPPFPPQNVERLSPSCGGKVPRDEAEGDGMCGQWRRDYEVEHGLYSSYALCSEKNGKTVVICVNQVTDNPELAKSIFETFRWTQ